MSLLDKREKNFEGKFALDNELLFKVRARRNKLIGLWAASQMGFDPEKAAAYALEIVDIDLKKAGDSDIIQRILTDLNEATVPATEKEITTQLLAEEAEAKKQILGQ